MSGYRSRRVKLQNHDAGFDRHDRSRSSEAKAARRGASQGAMRQAKRMAAAAARKRHQAAS